MHCISCVLNTSMCGLPDHPHPHPCINCSPATACTVMSTCVNFKLHRSNPQSHIILNISTLSKIHDQPLIQIPTSNVLCLALYKFLHMPIMTMNIRIKTKQRSSGNITISKSHPLFDPTTNQLVQKHTKTHEVKHIYTFWGGP